MQALLVLNYIKITISFKYSFFVFSGISNNCCTFPPLSLLVAQQETQVRSPGREDPLEEEMATPSSILAWRIPWTEEPCGLQSIAWQRVRHN